MVRAKGLFCYGMQRFGKDKAEMKESTKRRLSRPNY